MAAVVPITRGANPTTEQLSVAADAVAAAHDGQALAGFFRKLFAPSLATVDADYKELLQEWDANGWSQSAIVDFGTLMMHAQQLAGDVWDLDYSLSVRHKQVGDELAALPFYEPPGFFSRAVDSLKQFASNAGTAIGLPFDFLRQWGLWILLIVGVFLFLYLIRPWIALVGARYERD